jgi:hypothetical protein
VWPLSSTCVRAAHEEEMVGTAEGGMTGGARWSEKEEGARGRGGSDNRVGPPERERRGRRGRDWDVPTGPKGRGGGVAGFFHFFSFYSEF